MLWRQCPQKRVSKYLETPMNQSDWSNGYSHGTIWNRVQQWFAMYGIRIKTKNNKVSWNTFCLAPSFEHKVSCWVKRTRPLTQRFHADHPWLPLYHHLWTTATFSLSAPCLSFLRSHIPFWPWRWARTCRCRPHHFPNPWRLLPLTFIGFPRVMTARSSLTSYLRAISWVLQSYINELLPSHEMEQWSSVLMTPSLKRDIPHKHYSLNTNSPM